MLCRYVATYVAHTIALDADSVSVCLYENPQERVSALLVKDPADVLADADRSRAIASPVLHGVFGSPDDRDVGESVSDQAALVSATRRDLARDAPIVVITVEERRRRPAHTDRSRSGCPDLPAVFRTS